MNIDIVVVEASADAVVKLVMLFAVIEVGTLISTRYNLYHYN